MFTTPCFIRKNTSELRRKLRRLGYKPFWEPKGEGLCIATSVYPPHYTVISEDDFNDTDQHITWKTIDRIDCGTNEYLFLAIAALRDDSDRNQWFVTEEEMHWPNQDTWMPVGSFIFSCLHNYTNDDGKVHKATVEELIEHFGSDINVGSK